MIQVLSLIDNSLELVREETIDLNEYTEFEVYYNNGVIKAYIKIEDIEMEKINYYE